MGRAVRTAPTAVIAPVPGSSKQVIVAHEIVPMREEVFHPSDVSSPAGVSRALQQMQRHVAETTQSARSLPFLGGTYFPNIFFAVGVNQTFAHRVPGGVAVAFEVLRPRNVGPSPLATVVVEVSQDTTNGRITLVALPLAQGMTCDLHFFPQPVAAER
jgi:hypothetical protein